MNEIASAANAKYKTWASLLEARGIKKSSRALVSGRKIVEEILASQPSLAEELLYPPNFTDTLTAPQHVKNYRLASPLFKTIDVMGTKSPLLVAKTPDIPEWTPGVPHGLELIVALSDPGNMGALLRSAEAFGVSRVILSVESCSPFLPKAVRASSGACFRIKFAATGPLAEVKATPAFALDMNGENLKNFEWPKNLYLILGEEGRGVPKSLATTSISIPMVGAGESLNAMAAASIALYSYRIRN